MPSSPMRRIVHGKRLPNGLKFDTPNATLIEPIQLLQGVGGEGMDRAEADDQPVLAVALHGKLIDVGHILWAGSKVQQQEAADALLLREGDLPRQGPVHLEGPVGQRAMQGPIGQLRRETMHMGIYHAVSPITRPF